MVEAGACALFCALVAVGWNATIGSQHFSHMHEVPGHKGGVAVGEVIIDSGNRSVI